MHKGFIYSNLLPQISASLSYQFFQHIYEMMNMVEILWINQQDYHMTQFAGSLSPILL
jgi:hypothetical protein